jgi:hypothetical protein
MPGVTFGSCRANGLLHLYGWLYFGGKFGRDRHTCSIVNLLVAHWEMQYGVTFIWVVIVTRYVLNKE